MIGDVSLLTGDHAEAFLTRCIPRVARKLRVTGRRGGCEPYLYTALMSVDVDRVHFEVDTDGCDVRSGEDVVHESNHQGALAYT